MLRSARALRDGGRFTPEQAERPSDALAEAISGEVAARADLETAEEKLDPKIDDLRADLARDGKQLRADLGGDIRNLRTELGQTAKELRADLDHMAKDMRADLKAEVSGLRAEIIGMEAKFEAAKADTIKWTVGIISFQSVAIMGAAVVLARILAR